MGQSLSGAVRALAALVCLVAIATLAAPAGATPTDAGATHHADVGVASSAPPSAAGNVSAERTSLSTVTVNVSASAFPRNTSVSNATVRLAVGDRNGTYSPGRNASGTFVYRVPVDDLSVPGEDLQSASLTVDPVGPNASNPMTTTVNLQNITLGSASEARLNGSTLRVPVASSRGVGGGTDVAVGVGVDGAGPVRTWTADVGADGTGWLTVPVGRLDRATLLNGTFTLTPRVAGLVADRLRVNPRTAAVDASFERVENGLAVDHPLLFPDVRYVVNVETSTPAGRYVRTVSPGDGGRIVLPEQLLLAENRSVAVTPVAHDTTLFTQLHDPTLPRRTVTGSSLSLDGIGPSDLQAVWTDAGDRVRKISNPDVTDGRLALPSGFVERGTETVLLLQGRTVQPVVVNVTAPANGTTAPNGTATNGTGASNAAGNANGTATPTGTPANRTTASNGTGNATFGLNATANPSFDGSALTPVVIIGLIGAALSLLVWVLLDGRGGAGVAGAVATFFAVFGPGFGFWLSGSRFQGTAVFLVAAIVGAGIFAGTYLTVGFLLRTKSASYPLALVALTVAVLFSAVPAVAALGLGVPLVGWGVLYSTAGVGLMVAFAPGDDGSSSASGTPSGAATTTRTYTTTIEVFDDEAGAPIDGTVEITVEPDRGRSETTRQTASGSAQFELEPGTYTVAAAHNGAVERKRIEVRRRDRTTELRFAPRRVSVTVRDAAGRALPGAELTVEGRDGETTTLTADDEGTCLLEVPVTVSSLDARVTRAGYESEPLTIPVARRQDVSVDLAPLTGTLEGSVTVDGRAVEGVSVRATPERVDAVAADSLVGETDADGRVRFESVPVGRYVAAVDLAATASGFVASDRSVTVEDGATTTVDAPLSFDFTLSTNQERRVAEIRSDLESISEVSRRDTAIPAYYASVVDAVLGTAESVPDNGYPFLVHGEDPEAVVDALLDAGAAAAEQIDDVMRSKRNVDLFSACSDLPAADVRWEGTVEVEELLVLAGTEAGQQRGRFADRLEAVDERITDELSGLAETSPAREMWEGTRTLVRENTGADRSELGSAAVVVVAEALLDAVEQLFDHDPLRTRMEQTVF